MNGIRKINPYKKDHMQNQLPATKDFASACNDADPVLYIR